MLARFEWRPAAMYFPTRDSDCSNDTKVPARTCCAGFTYLALLFFVAIVGVTLVAVAQVWHTQAQREKEQQLLFVGNQFRQAIGAYYERTPGRAREFPKTLDDLLQDPRFPNVQRHLRQVYLDPMTGKSEWGFIRGPNGGLIGVHSLSEETPLKVSGFKGIEMSFAEAKNYRGWTFVYSSPDLRMPKPGEQPAFQQGPGGMPIPGPLPSDFSHELGPPESPEMASRELQCREQRLRDLETCSQTQAGGPGASADCVTSAARRHRACVDGETAPALTVR